MIPAFVHLRCRSAYTFGASLLRPSDIASLAAHDGMESVALVDRNLFGAREFVRSCQQRSLKPILGLECRLQIRPAATEARPLVLLAKDSMGLRNLMALASRFGPDGTLPRIPLEDLERHAQGLLALCGGKDGWIQRLLRLRREPAARKLILRLQEAFEGGFHLETHRRLKPDGALTGLAADTGTALVATCPLGRPPLEAGRLLRFHESPESQLLDEAAGSWPSLEQMTSRCDPASLAQTLELAEAIDPDLLHRKRFTGLAAPVRPAEEASLETLQARIQAWLQAQPHREAFHGDRLREELAWIRTHGPHWAQRLLFLGDAAACLHREGIRLGPGVGVWTCSAVAMALGIHDLDPLAHGLSVQRWLRPGTVLMPDGHLHVGTEQAAQAIQALARAFPGLHACTVFKPRNQDPEAPWLPGEPLPALAADTGDYGGPFQQSCLVRVPEGAQSPLWTPRNAALPVLQFTEGDAWEFGWDTLCLFHDPAVDRLETLLQAARSQGLDPADAPAPDLVTRLEDYRCGEVREVGTTERWAFVQQVAPETFEDLVVCMGWQAYGNTSLEWFASAKASPAGCVPQEPWIAAILAPSRGVPLYDQQVLDLALRVGLDPEEAEALRRAVNRRDHGPMERLLETFVNRARQRGLEGAQPLADLLKDLAFGFLIRSHCVARATLLTRIASLAALPGSRRAPQ